MDTTVNLKRGDAGKTFAQTVVLQDRDSAPSAPSVLFLMRLGSVLVTRSATVEAPTYDAETREVTLSFSYTTVAQDQAVAGMGWKQEWEISWAGGAVITWPEDGYNWVNILEDLNP